MKLRSFGTRKVGTGVTASSERAVKKSETGILREPNGQAAIPPGNKGKGRND